VVRIADVPEVMNMPFLRRGRPLLPARRVDYMGVLRAALSNFTPAEPGKRQHHHDAGRAQLLPFQGEDLVAQVQRGAARFQDRHNLTKDQILELYFNRYTSANALRLCCRFPNLLRETARPADSRRIRDARRPAQAPSLTTPWSIRNAPNPPDVCAAPHARTALYRRRALRVAHFNP